MCEMGIIYWKRYLLTLVTCCFVATGFSQSTWTSKHVQLNKDGSLKYIPDSEGNTFPDFSKVGCYQNSKPLPVIRVVKTIEATGDKSQQVLQSAIDEVSKLPLDKNGFRGAILLKKGIYPIPGNIHISASGIVLRGEGNETKLIATGKGQRNLIVAGGTGSLKEIAGTRKQITDHYIAVGSTSFTLSSSKGLKVGDSIIVFRPGTQKWIDDLKMNQIEVRDTTTKQWTAAEYDLQFERIITRVEGNRISIDNPIVMAMEDQYGGGEIYRYSFIGRINNVAVENLLCESEYNGDTDEDHGWEAVHFNKIENGWVRNVTSVYFGYSCVDLGYQSRNITVIDCKCLDAKSKIEGGRRYSFNNDGQMNLFMNCFASEGRHDFVTGAKVCGPNVFYNCKAEKAHADIGPHHRWAMGTLYDNIISDGEINAQDRGNWGTGHGWSGVNQIFWNCQASKSAIQSPWVLGKNYVIGLKGEKYAGRLEGRLEAEWEGQNRAGLMPVSLYQAQLKENKKNQKR
jgi:pectin methylesterase-like acyl-CoA thioesterase